MAVQARIEIAARSAGRDPSEIRLVAVSKTHPVSAIRAAIDAGVSTIGENRVQEAEAKISEVGRESAEWHLIGHLQSNKARKAVRLFDVIQSVDSVELAARLDRVCRDAGRESLRVFVQVDLAGEETKSGIPAGGVPTIVQKLKLLPRLRFEGLMLIPPYFEDVEQTRPFFRRLRELRDELANQGAFGARSGELSMGMSHDLEVAIKEGATLVRIGTAIFGERE